MGRTTPPRPPPLRSSSTAPLLQAGRPEDRMAGKCVKPSYRCTAKLFIRRTAAICAGAKARPHVARPQSGTRKVSDDEGKNRSAYRLIKALVTSGELRAGARLDPEKLREIADASLTTTYNALRGLQIEAGREGAGVYRRRRGDLYNAASTAFVGDLNSGLPFQARVHDPFDPSELLIVQF